MRPYSSRAHVGPARSKTGVQVLELAPCNPMVMEERALSFLLIAQAWRTKVVTEDIRLRVLSRRMVTLENELAIFQGRCEQQTLMDDADDDVLETMRYQSQLQ